MGQVLTNKIEVAPQEEEKTIEKLALQDLKCQKKILSLEKVETVKNEIPSQFSPIKKEGTSKSPKKETTDH